MASPDLASPRARVFSLRYRQRGPARFWLYVCLVGLPAAVDVMGLGWNKSGRYRAGRGPRAARVNRIAKLSAAGNDRPIPASIESSTLLARTAPFASRSDPARVVLHANDRSTSWMLFQDGARRDVTLVWLGLVRRARFFGLLALGDPRGCPR